MSQESGKAHPLGVLAEVSLSMEQAEMLAALEAYDLWFVAERLERKSLVPPESIDAAIVEFKRYMALIGLGYRGLGMTSPYVDEVWHAFVLFTRQYADFCQTIFGQFIHHVPETSRTPLAPDAGHKLADAYGRVFGAMSAVWHAHHQAHAAGVLADSCSYCEDD